MRYFPRFTLVLAVFAAAIGTGCGKNSAKSSSSSLINLSQYDTLQFKASASAFGVSGTRYDLSLDTRTVKKFAIDSTSGAYAEVGEAVFTAAMKNDFTSRLQKVDYKKFATCSDCNATRPSVWVEITEISPALYYFANEGDCSCPSDGENAPTLQYGDLKSIYDEILALF